MVGRRKSMPFSLIKYQLNDCHKPMMKELRTSNISMKKKKKNEEMNGGRRKRRRKTRRKKENRVENLAKEKDADNYI